MGPVITKQDVQNIVDNARNRIMDRVVTRQDVQGLTDNVRLLVNQRQQMSAQVVTRQDLQNVNDSLKNMLSIIQQNQQLLRQAEYQRLQLIRRVVALETRISQLEQELRSHKSTISRFAETRPQQVVPVQPQPQANAEGYQGQYVYRPV